MHVEVIRQPVEIASLFPHGGPRNRTQAVRLGGKCF